MSNPAERSVVESQIAVLEAEIASMLTDTSEPPRPPPPETDDEETVSTATEHTKPPPTNADAATEPTIPGSFSQAAQMAWLNGPADVPPPELGLSSLGGRRPTEAVPTPPPDVKVDSSRRSMPSALMARSPSH